MGMNVNECFFVGRLARPVEFTPAKGEGSARATGILIINRVPSRKPTKGPGYDQIPITAWGERAVNLARWTTKGKELAITGSIRTNSVKQADGSYRNYWEVVVRSMSFGRDSNEAKVMKALSGSSPEVHAALAKAVGGGDLKELLDASPDIRDRLRTVAQGRTPVLESPAPLSAPASVPSPASLPIPDEASVSPFTED